MSRSFRSSVVCLTCASAKALFTALLMVAMVVNVSLVVVVWLVIDWEWSLAVELVVGSGGYGVL